MKMENKDNYKRPNILVNRRVEEVMEVMPTLSADDKFLLTEQPKLMEYEPNNSSFLTEVRRFVLKEDCLPVSDSDNNSITRRFNYLSLFGGYPSEEQLNTMSEFGLKGDILEERFDVPNYFINVSKLERNMETKHQDSVEKGRFPKGLLQSMSLKTYCSHLAIAPNKDFQTLTNNNVHLIKSLINTKKVLLNLDVLPNVPTSESLQIVNLRYGEKKLKSALTRKIKNIAKINEEITNLKAIMKIEE